MSHPRIDPEIRSLMRPLTSDERGRLRAQIEADGCLEALVLWSNAPEGPTLVDGHNRLGICDELGIEYSVVEREFEDRGAVIRWIIDHQLGRRNLTPKEYRYWVGKRYEAEKREAGDTLRQNAPRGQNDSAGRTRDRIAAETGLSAKTVQRAYDLTTAIDAISERVGEDIKAQLLTGELPLVDTDTLELGRRDDIATMDQVRAFVEERQAARRPRPSSAPEKPFITKAVKATRTTLDPESGDELVEGWVLSCGHVAPTKRRTVVSDTHQKTAPCPECGSGTRTPYERRRTAEAFERALEDALTSGDRRAWQGLVMAASLVATVGPMDGRLTTLRAQLGEHLSSLGLMAIDARAG